VTVTKGKPLTVLSITAQGATQAGGVVNIPETGEVTLTIVADASSARDVPGRVLRANNPEGGLLVALVPGTNWENTSLYRFDQSDSDGTFAWRAVPPGEYLMFAFEDGEPVDYATAEVIRKLAPKGQKITITSDAKQTAVVQVIPR
jgi:Polysaccharide lyase family 4, domain II